MAIRILPWQTAYPTIPQPSGAGGTLPTGAEPQPVPYHVSPPWGEMPIYDEQEQETAPLPHIAAGEENWLHAAINDPFGHQAVSLDWYNDDQYGWPPPGAPNDQPFQSGHTQITVHNPSSEQGWGADPAFMWPRYPHMENKFPGYNHSAPFRRNGQWEARKLTDPIYLRMQQQRDHRLAGGPLMHRQHGVIVADASTVSHTENVMPLDPATDWPVPDGLEGVTPW